jgi:hypothetical protein
MASKSNSGNGLISITVTISAKGGGNKIPVDNIPSSTTIGDLKKKIKVQPNARLGRSNKFENWDNKRPLSDYFVKDGEIFDCVTQCMMEDGQPEYDDYNEWLAANKN